MEVFLYYNKFDGRTTTYGISNASPPELKRISGLSIWVSPLIDGR